MSSKWVKMPPGGTTSKFIINTSTSGNAMSGANRAFGQVNM